MNKWFKKGLPLSVLAVGLLTVVGCGGSSSTTANSGDSSKSKEVTITIGAYSVNQEAFAQIEPLFAKQWNEQHGQDVKFKESYDASGTQARAIAQGFEADVAALSLEADIDTITKAGLITHDWKKSSPHEGIVTDSVVALGTRAGNPKGIKDWEDLTKPGVGVLYPNPKTSGGAQWDINAIYGAGLKISGDKGKQDPAYAKDLIARVQKNVKSLDKSGRASMTTFEGGNGDVIVTYENELLARNATGGKYNVIIPKYTMLIENPVSVVDKNVEKHGNREVVEAFVKFLWSPEAQKAFAYHGFRPVDPDVAKQYADKYKKPEGLFDISFLGGWPKVRKDLYSDGALWDQILAGK
ncbi:MAG: sulfate ABC transporter substrate-binding protein [Tumebacillaceae bacterium]